MSLSLLGLVNTVQSELGLFPVASTVIGNTDQTVMQLLAIANALGRNLVTQVDWTAQQRTAIITPTAPTISTGDTTAGSSVITNVTPTTGIAAQYWLASGQGIPSAARVVLVNGSTVTLDSQATSTATGINLTFSQDRYDLPADLVKIIPQTNWDRTNHWAMIGPMSPQEDEWVRSGVVTIGPRRRFRITSVYGDNTATNNRAMEIWPPPQTLDGQMTLAYQYISNYWVRYLNAGVDTAKELFTADTDVCIFPDNLMVAGVKLRFWQIKGFDPIYLMQEYANALQRAISQDQSAPVLNMWKRRWPMFVTPGNIQDGSFPGP